MTWKLSGVASASLFLAVDLPLEAEPQGIYTGSFAGQTDKGGFAMIVIGGKAEIVGYNSLQEEGVYARNLNVAANGQFFGTTTE